MSFMRIGTVRGNVGNVTVSAALGYDASGNAYGSLKAGPPNTGDSEYFVGNIGGCWRVEGGLEAVAYGTFGTATIRQPAVLWLDVVDDKVGLEGVYNVPLSTISGASGVRLTPEFLALSPTE